MTSSPHGPYVQGDTRVTMAKNKGKLSREMALILKIRLSSDCSLQPDYMKLKSLVIAYQNDAVNTFSDLVHTARHTMRAVGTRNYLS
jgi:hypothetical protein